MLRNLTTFIPLLLLALAVLADASPHGPGAHLANTRGRQLDSRAAQPAEALAVSRASLGRRSCARKGSSDAVLVASVKPHTTDTVATKTKAILSKASTTTTTLEATASSSSRGSKTKATTTDSTTTTSFPFPSTDTTKSSSPGNTGAAGDFQARKPAHWPAATQSGPKPTSTVASASDPYLEELSKAIDNSGNAFFTESHTGDMTYYGQDLGACGDVYDDNSFTAAVSQLMYDNWPGASSEQNRNPICGPFVPGRMVLNSTGLFVPVRSIPFDAHRYATIGGDHLINCLGTGTGKSDAQCHVPLTATITNEDTGKSVQVQIVDRCEGCAVNDIDVTPTAFIAIADKVKGRVTVTWKFDNW